jgi:hypothetical protein
VQVSRRRDDFCIDELNLRCGMGHGYGGRRLSGIVCVALVGGAEGCGYAMPVLDVRGVSCALRVPRVVWILLSHS